MSTREAALALIFGIVGIVVGVVFYSEAIRVMLALVEISVTRPQALMIVLSHLLLAGFIGLVRHLWKMMADAFLHLRLALGARRAPKEP